MAKTPNHPQNAGPDSPTKWSTREDAMPKAGDYPNQNYTRTQSGHLIMLDDTKDKEHLTIQHRSGARVQFGPTGDIQFIAHNGQYSVVFGENRMEITGAQDILVKGGGTLKVDGDYDCTVGGNMNFACDNDFNFKGKSFNILGGGNVDIAAKNMTIKTEGSAMIDAGGAVSLQSEAGASLVSRGSSVSVAGATQVGILAKGGEIAMEAGGAMHIRAGGDFNLDAPSGVWLNSDRADYAQNIIVGSAAKVVNQQTRRSGPRHG